MEVDQIDAPPWQLAPTRSPLLWSFGRVTELSDLYAQRIFGPEKDLCCACGKHRGAASAGIVCDQCGVLVARDAQSCRRQRIGHIELACCCIHPLDRSLIVFAFPIAPLAFRRSTNGTLTELGAKFERLVTENVAIRGSHPERDCTDWSAEREVQAQLHGDRNGLQEMLCSIVGDPASRSLASINTQNGTLLSLLARAIVRLDPYAYAVARSCGLELRVNAGL